MSDLPDSWTHATLAEVASITLGQSPPGSSYNESGNGIPFFQGKAEFGSLYPTVVKWTSDPRKLAKAGDILLSVRAPVGPTNVAPSDCAIGRGLHAISPLDGVNRDYLLWAIRSSVHALAEKATGTTFEAVSGSNVKNHRIALAPTAEQRRIVDAIEEYFSRIDAAETSMRRASAQVERFRQKSFGQLFDQPGWKWSTLGEIADIKGGVTKDAKKQSHPGFVEVPYLRVANVQRGHLDLNEVTKIRVPPATLDALRLVEGDILLNEGGDRDKLGRGWIWEGQVKNCIHQNHVFRARLRDPGMNPRFFSTHANTWGRSWFETNGKQTTNLASISLSTLKVLPVPIPSNEEQALVVAELERRTSVVDSLLQSLEGGSREAESLRRSILAMAFSGRLVPQDPEEGPADVLLECIRPERHSSPNGPGSSKLVVS
jgi:type I restriction enzyme S subunit